MGRLRPWLFGALMLCFCTYGVKNVGSEEERKIYIVYMGSTPKEQILTESYHQNILEQVLEASSVRESMVYSYKKSFSGFAARLTEKEQQKLAGMKGVVSVFPSQIHQLHTTRTWDFMGFPSSVKRLPEVESDVIVGFLDSGIWLDSESFKDDGIGPPPLKWKGSCVNITCNNKVIGARYYSSNWGQVDSVVDEMGHGTHTSSTAAGREVKHASLFGLADGKARGAVPSARIAMYKVCGFYGCPSESILAAFDDAIHDGVDFLSLSLGGVNPVNYMRDSVAIGAFHAMQKGILSFCSAGNQGPDRGSAVNIAPWIMTVAANTIDRHFSTKVSLGNGKILEGSSLNTFNTPNEFVPLISGADAGNKSDPWVDFSGDCYPGSLDSRLVEGKIVYCNKSDFAEEPLSAGAYGSILLSTRYEDVSFCIGLPTAIITKSDDMELLNYLNHTKSPMAKIYRSETVFNGKAPRVGSFSSRGPNLITMEILKPDITAPGVDVLAAWPSNVSITENRNDPRESNYNILSGTSMSCPHVTGAAAYVKSIHPSWSASAIRSALMTTATPMDKTSCSDLDFGYGAGLINPLKAVDPGLVYETFEDDYIQMLCNEGFEEEGIRLITGDNSTQCNLPRGSVRDLNYPSMATRSLQNEGYLKRTFHRTVTNVGDAKSTYRARIEPHFQFQIVVEPPVLAFTSLYEKLSFSVTVSGPGPLHNGTVLSSSLIWSDGKHSVRSPIVVFAEIYY